MEAPVILVVDDEPDNFDVIETLLDVENYELHYSAKGKDAISSLELIRPDLILLDVMMPIMDGLEVCRHLKTNPEYKSIPVVMVTALTSSRDLARCFEAGAEDFISKPLERLELNARVRSMLKIRQQHNQLVEFNKNLETKVLERTKQLRAKSELIANLSHELRTPLNAILGFSQLLAQEQTMSEPQQKKLAIINRSGEHLLTLINDILEMSRIEAGRTVLNPEDFDLHQLLHSLKELFNIKAQERGIKLYLEYPETLPQMIHGDQGKLRQVLINLVGNGIKFTQQGYVKIKVDAGKLDNQLLFKVIDTGVGIEASELPSLFEAFSQTSVGKRSTQGTGLGLSISQNFVALMGGELSVTSELGKGSDFTFTVLVAPAKSLPMVATPKSHKNIVGLAAGHPIPKLLVVEDHLESQELLVSLLSNIGCDVKAASNGEEAIAVCHNWQPQLVWMDMCMPVMDGIETTKYLKSQKNPPIIIALSAQAFDQDRYLALNAGCDGFVRKPFLEDEIWKMLSHHLGIIFEYENRDSKLKALSPEQEKNQQKYLIQQQLLSMSPEWRQDLYESAKRLSNQQVEKILERIPPEKCLLQDKIKGLLLNFRHDLIIQLLDQDSFIKR